MLLFPALKEQSLSRDTPAIQGCFVEEQFVSPQPMEGAAACPGVGRAPGAGWATPQIPSPGFPSSCFAGCLCLTAQGAVRTCKDSTFLSSPLVCSSSSSTVWESGRSGKCLLCVSHARKEPRGGKKHPQHPAGVEAAQNEVQSPKMRCRPLKGSWEDCWALNQYPCSLIYSTGHMHALIGGVMVLHLIYLTTEGTLISY